MEQDIRDKVDTLIDRMADNTSKIENFFRVLRIIHQDMKYGNNSIESSDWHCYEEHNQEERKESVNKRWAIRIYWISPSSCRSPFIQKEHIPRCSHDSTICENCWSHKHQHTCSKPYWSYFPIIDIHSVKNGCNSR